MIRALLRRVLPRALVSCYDDVRALDRAARGSLVRLRLARWMGTRKDVIADPGRIESVLFVCHGNIMRSALAERLLRQQLAAQPHRFLTVGSAGTHAWTGRPAEAAARVVARRLGVSLDDHSARAVTSEFLHGFDLIVAMDHRNEAHLVSRFGVPPSKVVLLGAFAGGAGEALDVPDPFGKDDAAIEACFRRIERAVESLAMVLAAVPASGERLPVR